MQVVFIHVCSGPFFLYLDVYLSSQFVRPFARSVVPYFFMHSQFGVGMYLFSSFGVYSCMSLFLQFCVCGLFFRYVFVYVYVRQVFLSVYRYIYIYIYRYIYIHIYICNQLFTQFVSCFLLPFVMRPFFIQLFRYVGRP